MEPDYTTEQLSEYYLELERLLERLESSLTPYHVLDVKRLATQEEIKLAYQKAIDLLYPSYRISATVPEETIARMDSAFDKASRAFLLLANLRRRMEYDNPPTARGNALNAIQPPPLRNTKPTKADEAQATTTAPARVQSIPSKNRQGTIQVGHPKEVSSVSVESLKRTPKENRRRCGRLKVALPVRATGFDRKNGKWQEMAETIDVSRAGITLRICKRVRHGSILYLSLPLPSNLRTHGYGDSVYSVYAIVRRIDPPKKGVSVVGLEFLGEHPPLGYLEKPWAIFRTKGWTGVERRRSPRQDHQEVVGIEYFTESMQSISREMGRTEDISPDGMRVCVRAAPSEFDIVRVVCAGQSFESLASLSNRYVGKDGFERLCLRFMDNQWRTDRD